MADVRTTAQDGTQTQLNSNQAVNPFSAFHGYMMNTNRNGGDFGKSLTSGYAMIADALKEGSLEDAFANQFLRDTSFQLQYDKDKKPIYEQDGKTHLKKRDFSAKNIKKMKLVGGLIGGVGMVSAAGGAIRGILTDKNEKLDLPGIPGI